MGNLVNATDDMEAKERAIDEKLKLKKTHEENLQSIVGFARTLDSAIAAPAISVVYE